MHVVCIDKIGLRKATGVAAFARDMESAQQVWSAESGYPGDPRYREFYRDLGYDLDYDYIKPYLHSDGIRRNIGMKYHKITGEVAATHAGNFMFNRQKQIEYLSTLIDRKPLVVSMYDAELYGHWWYEGIDFLEYLFKKIYHDQKDIKLITPMEYLQMYPENQMVQPSMSSWGDKGYHDVWLNSGNDWIYRHLIKASERMVELANKFPHAGGLLRRALNQLARELVLMQSSDWAFLMTTGTAKEYSTKRTKDHIKRFNELYEQIQGNRIDEGYVYDLEQRDSIFQEMDYNVYSSVEKDAVLAKY